MSKLCWFFFFFHQPTNSLEEGVSNVSHCHEWKNYTGEVCLDELMKYQSCYHQQPSHQDVIYIPFETDQEEAEATATRLLQGLPLLSPSPECEAAIKPFLCLYLFGSCDTNNQSHQVTKDDCLRVREDVCVEEWELAERYIGQLRCTARLQFSHWGKNNYWMSK